MFLCTWIAPLCHLRVVKQCYNTSTWDTLAETRWSLWREFSAGGLLLTLTLLRSACNAQNAVQSRGHITIGSHGQFHICQCKRLHADYCGPFLGKYYALIVEDAFSKFPEVSLTTNATTEFTKTALRKLFAREGIAQVLVTDNGTHFTADHLRSWLKSIGCHMVYTAPRHPCSNGQAENYVRTLKTAIRANSPTTWEEINNCIDTFLLQYRNASHSSTGKTPAMLFKGRNLRTSANIDTTEITFYRGQQRKTTRGIGGRLNRPTNVSCFGQGRWYYSPATRWPNQYI